MSNFEIEVHEVRDTAGLRFGGAVLDLVREHPNVREDVEVAGPRDEPRFEIVSIDDDGKSDARRFDAWLADRWLNRMIRATGDLDEPACVIVHPTDAVVPVSAEEFRVASQVVEASGRLSRLGGDARMYRPMPPVVIAPRLDGSVPRLINVGVHTPNLKTVHRTFTVDVLNREIVSVGGVTRPANHDCEPTAPAPFSAPGSDGAAEVHVTISRRGKRLWDLDLRRPGTSSGLQGSAVELRNVRYLGRKVLHRAHVPMLNVKYLRPTGNCGPTYRDWQNQETGFEAIGVDPVPGYRICTQPPKTILESGSDSGNFSGVAFWVDGDRVRIVSEMAAGWYRYICEWWLAADGTISPRFGFAATANGCTCQGHAHHAYWRFDFDIGTPTPNVAEEYNEPPIFAGTNWHTKAMEIRRPRDAAHLRKWRVRESGTETGYEIVPGPHDGSADAYGAGDVWFLRYRSTEIDDGQGFTTVESQSRVRLDQWITGEPLVDRDIVVWYAGHFLHDHHSNPAAHGQLLGPDLVPFGW